MYYRQGRWEQRQEHAVGDRACAVPRTPGPGHPAREVGPLVYVGRARGVPAEYRRRHLGHKLDGLAALQGRGRRGPRTGREETPTFVRLPADRWSYSRAEPGP